MDVNTCYVLTAAQHPIAYYTHILPIAATLALSIFFLFKTRFSLLSRIFLYFCVGFVLWLIYDIVTWVTTNYYLVPFFWSLFDYTNVVFFLYGFYFLVVLVEQKDINPIWKWVALLISLPAFLIVVSGHSVLDFDQPTCGDNLGNLFLNTYKNVVEWIVMGGILLFTIYIWFKKKYKSVRLQGTIIAAALLLFFLVFTVTDYLSVQTNIYQIGLYGLLVMPVFLALIVYCVVTFETFNANVLGAQILILSLLSLIASEFIFVTTVTNDVLVGLTLVLTLFFGFTLVRSVKREIAQREQIEKLANNLEKANKQQVVLIHFITHQIKGFLTKSRNIFSMAVEGEFGPLPEAFLPMAQEGLRSDTQAVTTVQEILNASNVKSGAVTYSMQPFDFGALVKEVFDGLKPAADAKKLELTLEEGDGPNTLNGDKLQLQNAIKNLIDNSIKYTPLGSVSLKLSKEGEKLRLTIQDTGVGITPEDMVHLFTEGGHGKDSIKVNVDSTGFGLYIVKNIIEAHHGKVWVESEGAGKGSTFIVELPTNLEVTAMPVAS